MHTLKVGVLTCQLRSSLSVSFMYCEIDKRHLWKLRLKFVALYATGSNVSAYINMVCETLRNSIPKAVVFCQVREAKRALLNQFYSQIGRREVKYSRLFTRFLFLLVE